MIKLKNKHIKPRRGTKEEEDITYKIIGQSET